MRTTTVEQGTEMRIRSRSRRATMGPEVHEGPAADRDADEKRKFYEEAPSLPIPLDRGRLAKHWLPKECRLLDVGCGAGYHVQHLARKAGRVVATDVDRVSLPIARRRVRSRRVTFVRFDGRRLPFADASFDAVTLLDVLEHVADREALVAEVARVLRPGGTWIVSVPYRGAMRWLSSENMARDYPRWFRALDRMLPARFWVRAHNATGMRHEHFRCEDLDELAGDSFRFERAARRGSIVYALAYLGLCFPVAWLGRLWTAVCYVLMALDYQIPYGPCAYNLIAEFRRRPPVSAKSRRHSFRATRERSASGAAPQP